MDVAAESNSNPFTWLTTLIMALDLSVPHSTNACLRVWMSKYAYADHDCSKFLITFFYNQFRRLPSPQKQFTGKTVIVTGANVGLGLEAARHFVRLDAAKVILACRDTEKGERAKAEIERSTARSGIIEVWPLDLCSFESVRQFCQRADRLPRLDVVVENAAVAMVGPQGVLAEGYESTVTVNVVSTFLMALLLLPTLRRTATTFNVRPNLVIVSSDAHFVVRSCPASLASARDAMACPLTSDPGEFQGTNGTEDIRGVQVNYSGPRQVSDLQTLRNLPGPAASTGDVQAGQ